METKIYLLWFVSDANHKGEDELLIGVYESESNAKLAIERLSSMPGFVDHPEGFQIHSRELNKDSWTEGFVWD